MSHHIPERDPRSTFEDEGIPDLQDGSPEQRWAVDPQEAPVPGDRPMAVDDFGTTVDEQIQGESLEGRLAREIPEEQPMFGADEAGGGARMTDDRDDLEGTDRPARDDLDAGAPVSSDPYRAGRLVAPDEGAHEDREADLVAEDVGSDTGGYTAEEAAMRVEPE
ncbi:hypothetical protein GCM10010156_37080 [Planobispora rosea]|uniref:DUF5709 domain-containing protein n=1 Tax=Planobispora rosea TaxID=35762 RepID=A0A8J3WAE3_PLARO|nr:DUF5709 domain-containing protein [Planobispora rosea]GGS74862.1 hypothetical protein GCM10010156_37080 [Planobispora rosea]GIH81783.1 hypothetical protein Pro02_01910 [Planobispora rosea]